MKNLLLFIHPVGFDEECETLVKIQIENSLRFWKRDDIILATSFPYEFKGIKSIVVSKNNFCEHDHRVSKISALMELIDRGIIGDDLYWFHDMDAFQLAAFPNIEVKELGVTDRGKLNTGSFFFRKPAREIFRKIKEVMYEYKGTEEHALALLVKQGRVTYERINVTYNVGMVVDYTKVDKPIRVVHFHPMRKNHLKKFMPILTYELLSLFHKYGI